jgi:hypothetical protein
MKTPQELYDELSLYTLQKGDAEFVHQYIVDAWAAQNASTETKPITILFALAGLYLHVEKGWSGKRVQEAHMKMARAKRAWPAFELPQERGEVTVARVVAAPPGAARDAMIDTWSASVWAAWSASHERVKELLQEFDLG